jgi:hypothetical protein
MAVPLRWTCKSVANLEATLKEQGYRVGQTKIREILKQLGYSLQGNRKTREGKNHPDRDAQFRHIHKRVTAYRRGGRPAISVDTKKKETLGKKANSGREYRPKQRSRNNFLISIVARNRRLLMRGIYWLREEDVSAFLGAAVDCMLIKHDRSVSERRVPPGKVTQATAVEKMLVQN